MMTGTSDPARQYEAITYHHDKLSTEYMDKLRDAAPKSLSCFTEFMTPDEPPANHHEFFCEKLEAIERRDILRATFSCPPGHAKTKFCSRYFPAWYLGRNPGYRYLQGGHSQNFAENEFGKYVRDIIFDPRYREVFPLVGINPKSSAAGNWRIAGHRGGYVTKGVGQSIAGYRGHIGGIDDPFGSREDAQSETIRKKTGDWLFTDFRTRLLPGAPLFIIATRWHPDDLIGRVEALTENNVGIPWEIYNLTALIETEEEMESDPLGRSMGEALWPDFYGVNELLELKATLPVGDWMALYKGRPRDPEGNVVKGGWFKRYDRLPVNALSPSGGFERRIKRITVSVDCAEKATDRSAYTVALVWIEDMQGYHYLADVMRRKLEFAEMVTAIEEVARRWEADAILVEDAGAGIQYIQQRTGRAPAPVVRIDTENKSKEFRFDGVTTMIEAGEVWLPKSAPWLTDYENEILSFPNGTYKDQVDATSQYLKWARKRGTYGSKRLKGLRIKRAA
jgi:predicted phage terminase large subunit-like protein